MMNIEGLVKRIRTEFLDDTVGPSENLYLWKTPQIVAALSRAERELCKRIFLLHDSTTPAVCQLELVAAVDGTFPRTLAFDDRILRIERLKFPGVTQPLAQKTLAWLDQYDPGWDEKNGTPSHYVVDADDFSITFNRQPVSGGTVAMAVKRYPLIPIIEKTEKLSPEVKQLDDEIIHGALKYLFLKPDLEGYDAALSTKWAAQFESDIEDIIQTRAAINPQQYICRPERF